MALDKLFIILLFFILAFGILDTIRNNSIVPKETSIEQPAFISSDSLSTLQEYQLTPTLDLYIINIGKDQYLVNTKGYMIKL